MDMENALYSTLPKEVCQVSALIGIDTGICQTEDVFKTFAQDRIPRKDISDDFKFKTYSLYESIKSNQPASKQTKVPGKKLNCKQKKALFQLKHSKFNYVTFGKVNELWHSYFDCILAEVKTKNDELKLSRADFHGALLRVEASRNPTVIGLQGFVIQESKQTFRIVNNKDRILTIPKTGTVFTFEHRGKLYKLNGSNILMSSFNRSKLKPKLNNIYDL